MGMGFDTVEEYWDLSDASAALGMTLESQIDPVEAFEKEFANFVGGLAAVFLDSGREAIYQALRVLKLRSGDEMILPGFICPVVADALIRARVTPVVVDIQLPSGGIDPACVLQALSPRTKAVLIAHLYGVPCDFRMLKLELEQRNIAIIEDCAPCLGGTIDRKLTGSLGTLSVFSFNYDKPISLGNGGMLVCADSNWLESFTDLKSEIARVQVDSIKELESIEAFLEWLALRRRRIRPDRLVSGLSLLKGQLMQQPLVRRAYASLHPSTETSHLFNSVGPVRANLGRLLLQRYPAIMAVRNRNAEYLLRQLKEITWGEVYEPPADIQPAYVRVNLFAGNRATWQVDRMASHLCYGGFRAGRFNWPRSLDQLPHLQGKLRPGTRPSNAHKMAGRCLNMPIHQNMDLEDLDRMLNTMRFAEVQ